MLNLSLLALSLSLYIYICTYTHEHRICKSLRNNNDSHNDNHTYHL